MPIDDHIDEQFGNYITDEFLAKGPFMDAYVAKHKDDVEGDRTVVVKVLKDPKYKSRLEQEVNILERFGSNPNILDVHDYDLSAEHPWIIVEHCESSLAKEMIGNTLSPEKVIDYILQTLKALEPLHEAGITHGNLKPSNIFINKGIVKLADFNTRDQKYLDGDKSTGDPTGFDVSQYITPEHHADMQEWRHLVPQSDLHQLGQIAYHALTQQLFIHRSADKPIKVKPHWMEKVIAKATMDDLSSRYPTAADMIYDIEAGLEGKLDGPSLNEKASKRLSSAGRNIGNFFSDYSGELFGTTVVCGIIAAFAWGVLSIRGCIKDDEARYDRWAVESADISPSKAIGYISTSKDALIVSSVQNTFNGGEKEIYPLQALYEAWVGFESNKFFYVGSDSMSLEGKDKDFPQIYIIDLDSNENSKAIQWNYALKDFKGKEFQEVHIVDAEKNKLMAMIDGEWYSIEKGDIQKGNYFKIPKKEVQRDLGFNGYHISEYTGTSGFGINVFDSNGVRVVDADFLGISPFVFDRE
ncbi:protein kinase [Candidatus Woesearchaeota archaeon]|nr:protein kinase [Candidatus Woesearchaeota archaeon]